VIGKVNSCACGRLGEQQRRINLQQEGFVLSPSVVALQVERVAAEVFMKIPENQDDAGEIRELGKGYPALRAGH